MSQYTTTCTEVLFQNNAEYTAVASFTSETSFIPGGDNAQPTLGGQYFLLNGKGAIPPKVRLIGKGIVSSTGTPTYTLKIRLSTSQAQDASGTVIAASAAVTTQSGVANCHFEFEVDIVGKILGQGSGNLTIQSIGTWRSAGGFAAPYEYDLTPGAGASATWTIATSLDANVPLYFKPTITCSASSSSNSIRLKSLALLGMN